MRSPLEKAVFRLANHPHPWIHWAFGMSRDLLARNDAREEKGIAEIERQVWGPEGIDAWESRNSDNLRIACRRAIASTKGKRALRPGLPCAVRVLLNLVGLLPLLVLLGPIARLRSRLPAPRTLPAFGFLPSPGFAAESERLLGVGSEVTVARRPLLDTTVLRFLTRAIAAEPRLLLLPELLTNALRWLAYYRWVERVHAPGRIGNYAEGVVSMPLVDAYCRERGIVTVNLQHGERVVSRHIAFMRFGEAHFWADKYARVYQATRCIADSIWLSGNGLHRRLFREGRQPNSHPDRTLLVVHHRIATMGPAYAEQVRRVARTLGPQWRVEVRRHPGDDDLWRQIIADLESQAANESVALQQPNEVPIDRAVLSAPFVIGATSTALIEAWISGAKVVIVPGMADAAAAMEAYGGSPNVLWLDATVPDQTLESFLREPRHDGPEETARIDRITLVSSEAPVPWTP